MTAISFALPHESRELVAALRFPMRSGSTALPIVSGTLGGREVVIFHTGVGAASAREWVQEFWDLYEGGRVDCVIGAGFAGGLNPGLPAGTLVLAENYPDRLSVAHATLGKRVHVGPLATASHLLETRKAKAELAQKSNAIAVDMESATLASFFCEKRVPFLALRVISDAANEPLPVPFAVWWDAHTQQPRPLALLWFLLLHPERVLPFVRFVRTIHRARRTLAVALRDLVTFSSLPHAAAGPAPQQL